jgi:hypothetical protein
LTLLGPFKMTPEKWRTKVLGIVETTDSVSAKSEAVPAPDVQNARRMPSLTGRGKRSGR